MIWKWRDIDIVLFQVVWLMPVNENKNKTFCTFVQVGAYSPWSLQIEFVWKLLQFLTEVLDLFLGNLLGKYLKFQWPKC